MNKTIKRAGFTTFVFGCLFAGAACTGNNQQPGKTGEKTQVIDEKYTRESQNLGAMTERQGEAEVQGRREIIQKRTEQIREDIPTVVIGEKKADLNRMEVKDFRTLGLSEQAAKNAVEYRKQHGDQFTSVDELKQVPGMDQNWLAKYQDKLAISSQAAGEAGTR